MEVKLISDPEALTSYLPAWEALADAALEPNPFYEHWMLLPALRSFGPGKDLRVALVFRDDPARTSAAPLLCGVFPLERHHRYMGLPISAWGMWKHAHCFLTTPLLRKEHSGECLAALFDWLSSKPQTCSLLEWRYLPGEGPFHQLLVDQLNQIHTTPLIWEWFTRALFRPMETGEQYLAAALSGKHRKALRRRAELLSEMGSLKYAQLEPGADVTAWIDSFLRLEASGWKGKEGTALGCQEANRSFFVNVATEAFRRNRFLMPAMHLNGNPIAQNCYFRAGEGSFHFKTSFDEEYCRFSPGFHLECEMIRYLHTRPDIEWMDSCTSTNNEMYNRLFLLRRTIQSLLIPLGKGVGRFVVSTIPLLRSFKRSAHSLRDSLPGQNGKVKSEEVEVAH